MNKLELWTERLVLFFICLVCVAVTYAVFETASSNIETKQEPRYYKYPTVPECDQELWERIKDRCANEE